jgi:hypothetical protein
MPPPRYNRGNPPPWRGRTRRGEGGRQEDGRNPWGREGQVDEGRGGRSPQSPPGITSVGVAGASSALLLCFVINQQHAEVRVHGLPAVVCLYADDPLFAGTARDRVEQAVRQYSEYLGAVGMEFSWTKGWVYSTRGECSPLEVTFRGATKVLPAVSVVEHLGVAHHRHVVRDRPDAPGTTHPLWMGGGGLPGASAPVVDPSRRQWRQLMILRSVTEMFIPELGTAIEVHHL